MVIRILAAQERYNGRNKGGWTESRNKPKKLKSVKVANLDKLRLSMRRDKQRFDSSVWTDSSDYATDLSGVSSEVMSGRSSPNYMKATTSSARKGSLQSSSARKSNPSSPSKFNRVLVEECSYDPAGVSIPVQMKPGKTLKRVSSSMRSKKLSSMKSMKIRTKYSQFQDVQGGRSGRQEYYNNDEINEGEIGHEYKVEGFEINDFCDQEIKGGAKRGILERSRSIKLTRLRSKRLPRRLPKSRLGRTAEQMTYGTETSNAVPHYMKGTTSHETRKSSAKGLTRTSSLRPLRILAKIPSLRPKRSKLRKRPEKTPLSGTRVDRATCSSTLKRSEYPEQIELHPKGRESEGTSLIHVCPYSYCSLNGHHHHAPSLPIKDFIAAKRQLINNQKGKQLENQYAQDVNYSTNASNSYQSRHMVSSETREVAEMMNGQTANALEVEDDGQDFLIKIYGNRRKKWAIEGTTSRGSEALISYASSETSAPQVRQAVLEELQKAQETFSVSKVEADDKDRYYISTAAASNETVEQIKSKGTIEGAVLEIMQFPTSDSEVSPGDDLTNILSDTQKYTGIWHLIHQQFVSSYGGTKDINEAYERKGVDQYTSHKNEFDQEHSRYSKETSEEEDDHQAATENLEFNQTAVIKLVQEALHKILQLDTESANHQSQSDHEMVNSLAGECILTSSDTEDKQLQMKQLGNTTQKKVTPIEEEMPERQMTKSYSRLRKIFVTAKLIKTMERMKKINSRGPQYLSAGIISEEQRVYLRHLSMDERKNIEEWMLDYALRQVISKLNPDQQRRVAQLVEAFETVTPEKRGKGIRYSPQEVKSTMSDLDTSINKETEEHEQAMSTTNEQYTCMQNDEMLLPQQDAPEVKSLREEHGYQATTTDLASELSRMSYKSASAAAAGDDGMVIEEPTTILEDSSLSPTGDSEVSHSDDMTNIFSSKQKYNCMWNLIYQHAGKASIDENQGVDDFHEKEETGDENSCDKSNDPESTRTSYSKIPNEDVDDQNASHAKHDFNQSTAVKLVKEALNAILKSYEQTSECQSIPEHHEAVGTPRELCISSPTSYNEESCKRSENIDERVYPEPEHKVYQVENTSHSPQQQEEVNELQKPPKKMSKSLSKLKKAITTARFIKAIGRLRNSSPRKSQSLPSETESKEKVYLRHLSMSGRKTDEEWMLDYALRQVIFKMDPDQQRKVALLVEAFETVNPEQKNNGPTFCTWATKATPGRLAITMKEGTKQLAKEKHQRPIADEEDQQVPQGQDGEVLLSSESASPQRSLQEDLGHQAREADDIVLLQPDGTSIQESTSGDLAVAESTIGIEQTSEAKFCFDFPTKNSEIKSEGDIATILNDKQNYTSMWRLIYQQVASSEASTAEKKEYNELDEEDFQQMNDLESRQIISKEAGKDEDSQSETRDQSAAIKMVQQAINAILQHHENISDQKPLQFLTVTSDRSSELRSRSAPVYTEENTEEDEKRVEFYKALESADQLHKVDNTSGPLQEQAEAKEANTTQKQMSKSYKKLRKLFATAKFIKAMERLQKTNWRKPRHLSPESASQEERVNLRHPSISGSKNDEEWMLDYALRKVISSLPPDQQRKVGALVKAFEKVSPEMKEKGVKYQLEDQCTLAESEIKEEEKEAVESQQTYSMPNDDNSPEKHDNRFSFPNGASRRRKSQEDCHQEIPSFRTQLSSEVPYQANPEGSPAQDPSQALTVQEDETDANTISESLQHAPLSKNLQQDYEHNIAESILADKQKKTSMWHLICQHVQSVSVAEAGSELSEGITKENHMSPDNTTLEVLIDPDADENDASSVTSELTENEAIKLVKEAIDDILDMPEDHDNELISSTSASALEKDQRAVGQKPNRRLSRGYSKLRKYIICNKFIKAMQKMQRIHPQTRKNLAFNPGPEAGKALLKTSAAVDRKPTDEWMLDNVLQRVISGLAPVQQRRVALLINAFEQVNPDLEERGIEASNIKKAPTDAASLEGNIQEKEEAIFVSTHTSELPDEFILQKDRSIPASDRVISTERVPQGISEDRTPCLCEEYAGNGKELGVDVRFHITPPSVTLRTTTDTFEDATEASAPEQPGVLRGKQTPVREQLVGNSEQEVPQIEHSEDGGTYSARSSTSLGKERFPNLWGLILQHVKTDIAEETQTQMPPEDEADALVERPEDSLNDITDDTSELFPEADDDEETYVPTPTIFEFQENEVIKLVRETINELLLLPEQIRDKQSISTHTTSEQGVCDQSNENGRETSLDIAEIEASLGTDVAHVEKVSENKNSGNAYNNMSKVILSKRFIKTMDKMRRLKPQPPQKLSGMPPTAAEGIPSLRQSATSENKTWEEGMLDHALQQVVGKLAPAQKKRVALLVQAFEAVGSQPEPGSSRRVKAAIS